MFSLLSALFDPYLSLIYCHDGTVKQTIFRKQFPEFWYLYLIKTWFMQILLLSFLSFSYYENIGMYLGTQAFCQIFFVPTYPPAYIRRRNELWDDAISARGCNIHCLYLYRYDCNLLSRMYLKWGWLFRKTD